MVLVSWFFHIGQGIHTVVPWGRCGKASRVGILILPQIFPRIAHEVRPRRGIRRSVHRNWRNLLPVGHRTAELQPIPQWTTALKPTDPGHLPAVDHSFCKWLRERPRQHHVVSDTQNVGPVIRQRPVASPPRIERIDGGAKRAAPDAQRESIPFLVEIGERLP